jgi:TonB family protein
MDNFQLYLLKVSAGTILFYLSYLLIFNKDTFYQRNRVILILTLFLPTLLPALKIPVLSNSIVPLEPINPIDKIYFLENSFNTTIANTINSDSFDYNILFIWIYFTVAGLLLLRVVISLISTYRIIKKGTVKNYQFPKVIISDRQLPPFSFFPYAVIPVVYYKSSNYTDILDHEFAHIRQGHTFDLILCELFIAFQWFNPFIWLIRRSIVLNHEYLADNVSVKNKSVKEYQYLLLNFQLGFKDISLAHNFHSFIENRIIMINKKPTMKYAALKNILFLPLVALVVYAFATPEYNYVAAETEPSEISPALEIIKKEVKGIVLNEDGNPLEGVNIRNTGTMGNAFINYSGPDGRFVINYIQADAYLNLFLRGYKTQLIKAEFNSEIIARMVKDEDYKEPEYETATKDGVKSSYPIVVLDGLVTKEPAAVLISKMGAELGTIVNLTGKEATEKYGEAGKNGATEIYTRKKALKSGIKIPFRRSTPDDYPTFQGGNFTSFNDWVISQIKYPSEATSGGIHGRVIVTYSVEVDGSISKVGLMGKPDPLLGEAVIKTVQASPKWEPPKNPEAKDPFSSIINIKFELPDKVFKDDAYISAEKMPQYPGGVVELSTFIKTNTKYPEAAKPEKVDGTVIVRFIVNKNGDAEDPVILKSVHPLLDAEALRVVNLLKGFSPGSQGGMAVNVYSIVKVTFSIPAL